jgi:VWFA-related protein
MRTSDSTHARVQSRRSTGYKLILSRTCRLGAIVSLFLLCVPALSAQEVADTIKVRTRVVFMDALVKEKRTGVPITDLKPENFEVFDDGKPRSISYFTREGQARKPIALVIILDCRGDGAGRFLKQPEILKAMTDELAKLPPGDEVGIMAMNIGDKEKRVWLTSFTNDRSQIAAALDRVPGFVDKPEQVRDESEEKKADSSQSQGKASISVGSDSNQDGAEAKPDSNKTKAKEVAETETIKGKNGAVVTRTVMQDGSVNVKRVNSKGNVTIAVDNVYDMAAAVRDAANRVEKERPNSQTAIVWVSDGIAPIFYEDRDATEQVLIHSNAIFNSLTVNMRTLFKFLLPIGQPLAGWMGVSLAGSAKHLAQQTGGEAAHANSSKDYGVGLSRIIGNLTARYNLGFRLGEEEKDDGRMHELAIKVMAIDLKGKPRKLDVSSRRGYYMPKNEADQTANNK